MSQSQNTLSGEASSSAPPPAREWQPAEAWQPATAAEAGARANQRRPSSPRPRSHRPAVFTQLGSGHQPPPGLAWLQASSPSPTSFSKDITEYLPRGFNRSFCLHFCQSLVDSWPRTFAPSYLAYPATIPVFPAFTGLSHWTATPRLSETTRRAWMATHLLCTQS